jgi:hypothetical protein
MKSSGLLPVARRSRLDRSQKQGTQSGSLALTDVRINQLPPFQRSRTSLRRSRRLRKLPKFEQGGDYLIFSHTEITGCRMG